MQIPLTSVTHLEAIVLLNSSFTLIDAFPFDLVLDGVPFIL